MESNGRRIVAALTATKFGDAVVDAKTVLPWLLGALAAPAALIGLLVPIRESGALLPQASLLPVIRARPRRTPVWLVGAAGQALAVALMAVLAFTARGTVAGVGILVALAGFALSRSLCSVAVKDVMGRTITKGLRGRVSGTATTIAGVVAIVLGVGLRGVGPDAPATSFGVLLLGGGAMWLVAMVPFGRIDEPAGEHDTEMRAEVIRDSLALLRDDAPFRRFVVARTLLLVTALSPPYVVALAQGRVGSSLAGLGPFVVASGIASLVGGRVSGVLSDRSSRLVMVGAAAASTTVVVAFVVLHTATGGAGAWLYVGGYFLLALAHTATRVGRTTYVVDLAEGNQRTDYVAVSNTAMGVLLLVVGALTGALATLGPAVALLGLAVIGGAAVPVALTLPEVGAHADATT